MKQFMKKAIASLAGYTVKCLKSVNNSNLVRCNTNIARLQTIKGLCMAFVYQVTEKLPVRNIYIKTNKQKNKHNLATVRLMKNKLYLCISIWFILISCFLSTEK